MLERVAARAAPLGRRVVPDREPLPLQREVRPALGAALRPLRGPARPGPRRARGRLGRGPDPEAAGPPMRLPRGLGGEAPWSPLRIGVFVLAGVALLLPAWALYLAVVLPPRARGAELGRRLGRPRPRARRARGGGRDRIPSPLPRGRPCSRGALAAALVCDAWFDVMTSDGERPLVRDRAGASRRAARSPCSPPWSACARCLEALREQAEAAVDDQRLAAHHLGVG